jgi:hypothetical protein
MKNLFLKSMAVCAAVVTFGSGAYVVGSGAGSLFDSRVKSVLVSGQPAVSTEYYSEETSETVDSPVRGVKKLGKPLK